MELLTEPAPRFPLISHNVDKGKGHVFAHDEECERMKRQSLWGSKPLASAPNHDLQSGNEVERGHSFTSFFTVTGSTSFALGSYANEPLSGNLLAVKRGRKRPSAWNRRSRKAPGDNPPKPQDQKEDPHENYPKRKAEESPSVQTNKEAAAIPMSILNNLWINDNTI
ncbi:unnamed protein product [Arabis nemorensis]|uniref:Uncharacterized protein n=1 Tax=Arabis nemorensis TaxID=586526 RepID=A0A565BCB4_9BRAS|nr:unnamed protein product [Arabis nemorensis]